MVTEEIEFCVFTIYGIQVRIVFVIVSYERDAWLRIVNKFKLSPEKLVAQNVDQLISLVVENGNVLSGSQRAALQVCRMHPASEGIPHIKQTTGARHTLNFSVTGPW